MGVASVQWNVFAVVTEEGADAVQVMVAVLKGERSRREEGEEERERERGGTRGSEGGKER